MKPTTKKPAQLQPSALNAHVSPASQLSAFFAEFQSKPIIKDTNRRLASNPTQFSKQYTPEYFTTILQYLVERQESSCGNNMKKSAQDKNGSENYHIQKIKKYRAFMERQKQIEKSVWLEMGRVKHSVITSRKQQQKTGG